jgi:type II secretory pathway component GspD/PulD (secretin)
VDPSSLKAQLETRVFRLRFVRPNSNYKPIIETQVSKASVTPTGDRLEDIEKEFNLLNAFKQTVAPEGSVTYFAETNSLIVTGTTPKLEALERLIARIDTEPSQVFVDVKFIATSNTDFSDIGFGPGENGISANITFGSMLHDLPFQLNKGGFEDRLSPFRGGPEGFGPLPITNSGTAFQFGTLDFSQTQFALNLIKRDRSSRIVQAPKLVTMDNQAATIFVGDTIRFAQTKASSNQSGGLEFSLEEAENSPIQVGFQLLMIPHVIPDKDQIMMTVIPQQRSLTGPDDGFRTFSVGAGATVGEQTLLLPQETSSTVVTNLKLDNGHTAVIGGLLQDRNSESENKVPFLGDIPILGYLFKTDQKSKTRDNLIIFLTPRIVRDPAHMHNLVLRELNTNKDRIDAEMLEIYGTSSLDTGSSNAPANVPAPPKSGMSGPK